MYQKINNQLHSRYYNRILLYGLYFFIVGFVFNFNIHSIYPQDANITINTTKLTDSLYMLEGSGGNIVVSVGEDGVFMVDDQFAPLTEKIINTISEITDQPITFVINTHWHPDHTGGNENLGDLGAIIVSHDNVRKRLSAEQFSEFFQRSVPPLSERGLPIVTFSDNMTIYQNNDEINIVHVDNGHTDGDSIVYFKNNNVIHIGDNFRDKAYPFIDLSSGGSIDGLISALETTTSIINDNTKVVSGHSEVSSKTKLVEFTNMLKDIRDQINNMIEEGKSLEEIIASNPTSQYDEIYSDNTMLNPDDFVTHIYQSLTNE